MSSVAARSNAALNEPRRRLPATPRTFFMAVSHFAQVAPRVQLVVVLEPALANIVAIIHVRDHDVANARISLRLSLAHRLTDPAYHEHDAGSACHVPLAVHLLHVLDVDFFRDALLEENGRILRYGLEGRVIVEWKGRHHHP